MGTKNNPGRFDCYDKAHADEPMFVLLGRDSIAPIVVEMWAKMRRLLRGRTDPKADEAFRCAEAMRVWRCATRPSEGHCACSRLRGHVGPEECCYCRGNDRCRNLP